MQDIFTFSEGFGHAGTFTRDLVSDVFTFTDSSTRTLTATRSLQDTITFTDSLGRDVTVTRVLQDQFSFVENLDSTVTETYTISGVSKDSSGTPLATCECYLMKDNQDDTLSFVDYVQSDGSGNYLFTNVADNDSQYLVIFWKDDSPHIFDVTDHVLQPTQ
jgi:hypothetical protein